MASINARQHPLCTGLIDQARQYARLMRLDRPIGIWLLLWPTLWALWIAGSGHPQARYFIVFVAGVIVMRSAGCVINDFADRHIDGKVQRTRDRPLAAGNVAPVEALVLFAVLGLIALALVLKLNQLTRLLALGGALLTVVYPFTKRLLAAPQLVLGAAFGWGMPMAFAAETEAVPAPRLAAVAERGGLGGDLRHHVRDGRPRRRSAYWRALHRHPVRQRRRVHHRAAADSAGYRPAARRS